MTKTCTSVNVVTGRRTTAHLAVAANLTVSDIVAAHPQAFCQSVSFFKSLKFQTKTSPISLYREVASALVSDRRSRQ